MLFIYISWVLGLQIHSSTQNPDSYRLGAFPQLLFCTHVLSFHPPANTCIIIITHIIIHILLLPRKEERRQFLLLLCRILFGFFLGLSESSKNLTISFISALVGTLASQCLGPGNATTFSPARSHSARGETLKEHMINNESKTDNNSILCKWNCLTPPDNGSSKCSPWHAAVKTRKSSRSGWLVSATRREEKKSSLQWFHWLLLRTSSTV